MSDVFLGLRSLGFGERVSRRAVEIARPQVRDEDGFVVAIKLALAAAATVERAPTLEPFKKL
jgi:hypothetical protein